MNYKYYPGLFFLLLISLIFLCILPSLAFDVSQSLTYEGSYIPLQERINHTVTLDIDYFQEVKENIFLEGDLLIRSTNKEFAKPFIIAPNEIYLSGYNVIENLDLKAGKIISRWGAADIFSPLDNFNPAPPEISLTKQQGKLGAFGINATYYLGNSTYLNGTMLPKLMPTPYPDKYLKTNYMLNYGPSPISQEQAINLDQVELTYQEAEKVIWGLRLTHSFPSFDAGISYYHGYYMDPFPVSIALSTGNSMDITLGYPSKQVIGLEFQGEFPGIEEATLRGDLAYIMPEYWEFQGNTMLDEPYFQAIISADYTTESNLYLNGGFIYGLPFERGDKCSPYLYLNSNKELEDSDLKPFYVGVLSLKDFSMINVVGFDYQITENVSASFNYSSLLGNKESKLSLFERSEGIYLTLEWLF